MSVSTRYLALWLIGFLITLTGFSGCNSHSDQIVLKLAHYANQKDEAHQTAKYFKQLVEKRTDRISIVIHPNSELGNAPSLLQSVRIGTIDMVLVGNPFYESFAPHMSLLDLPFLFKNREEVSFFLDGKVGERLFIELLVDNLKGLAFWDIGFRNLTNSQQPISKPNDLKGLKIRTTPNRSHIATFESLGANPSPLPFTELYLALKTGMMDGQENPLNQILAYRFFEVQKHLSLTRHIYTAAPFVMNLGRFNALDTGLQQILIKCAVESAIYSRELNAASDISSLDTLIKEGMVVVKNPKIDEFIKQLDPKIYKNYSDRHGSELLDLITDHQW